MPGPGDLNSAGSSNANSSMQLSSARKKFGMQAPSALAKKFENSPGGLNYANMIEDGDNNEYGLRIGDASTMGKKVTTKEDTILSNLSDRQKFRVHERIVDRKSSNVTRQKSYTSFNGNILSTSNRSSSILGNAKSAHKIDLNTASYRLP